MQTSLILPKTPKARAAIIQNHLLREKRNNAYWRALSLLALYYSLGFRHFDVMDPVNGDVKPTFFDEKDGGLEYWSTALLFEIQEIVGHMTSLDMGPAVLRTGTSLSAIRDRSIAQVLLDSTTDRDRIKDAQRGWAWLAAMYGMAGISTSLSDSPTVGLSVELEVVHPEELYPFPSLGTNQFSARGVMRNRAVPLDWLRAVYGNAKVNRALKSGRMIRTTIQFGESLQRGISTTAAARSKGTNTVLTPPGAGESSSDTALDIVEITELWVTGPTGTVNEYCLVSGGFEFEYLDYRTVSVYPTLNTARFYENGSWYGTSHFYMRYGSHRAAERMLSRLFRNIRQQDKYGILVLPQGEYNEDTAFADYGEALKFLKIRPDVFSDSFKPFSVPVPNTGTLPFQAVQAATAEGDRVNPVPDLIQNKGRIDSAAGLSALEQSSRKAITNPEQSMIRVFSSSWRSGAQQIATALTEKPRPVPVKRLNLDMLGVIIGDGDLVSFDENPIPNIRLLRFSVQEDNPKSVEVRKQEAQEALGAGLMTPDEYKLFLLQEGIDVAMWTQPHKAIYERTVRRLLRLYGDGKTPGQIVATADTTRPDLELMILEPILYGDALAQASVQVQNEFQALKQYLEAAQGFALPPGVPSFEELLQSPGIPASPPGTPQGTAP